MIDREEGSEKAQTHNAEPPSSVICRSLSVLLTRGLTGYRFLFKNLSLFFWQAAGKMHVLLLLVTSSIICLLIPLWTKKRSLSKGKTKKHWGVFLISCCSPSTDLTANKPSSFSYLIWVAKNLGKYSMRMGKSSRAHSLHFLFPLAKYSQSLTAFSTEYYLSPWNMPIIQHTWLICPCIFIFLEAHIGLLIKNQRPFLVGMSGDALDRDIGLKVFPFKS